MAKEYGSITADIAAYTSELRKIIPDVMGEFSNLAQTAAQTKAPDEKTKEFVALALGVAAHCDGCIGFHIKALARLGASREEVAGVLGMAIYMGGGPSVMYAADALSLRPVCSSIRANIVGIWPSPLPPADRYSEWPDPA